MSFRRTCDLCGRKIEVATNPKYFVLSRGTRTFLSDDLDFCDLECLHMWVLERIDKRWVKGSTGDCVNSKGEQI